MTQREKLSVWLIGISVMTLFVSNLLAIKLTVFAGIAVDCGIILYPVSYIVGDLSVEFLGRRRANLILYAAGLLSILSVIFLLTAVFLPAYPGWAGQAAFEQIFGFAPRIVLGSVAAFLVAGLANNLVFEKLRSRNPDSLALRVLGSSAVAHAVDSLIFETIAFLGVLSFREFLAQATFAYLAGLTLECLFFHPLTKPIARRVQRWLDRPLT